MSKKKEQFFLSAVDKQDALAYVSEWACLRDFPRTDEGILGLARAFASICPRDKYDWLFHRVLMGAERCPTPLELRRIATKRRYKHDPEEPIDPRDGLEVEDLELEG